ncbi:MAG: hypothetical protein RL591_748 [Planctomycetota bacterium]
MTTTMQKPLRNLTSAVLGTTLGLAVPVTAHASLDPSIYFAPQDDGVKTATVHREAEFALPESHKAGEPVRERILAEITNGELELVVDSKLDETTVVAEFVVDGADAKDVERREKNARLFATRSADGSLVFQPIFPGTEMPRDRVKLIIRTPGTGDSMVKSTNGAIVVRGTSGALRAITKNGSIKIAQHTGGIEATAQKGTIEIALATDGVRATTANGAIRISLADGNDHPFKIESKAGSVDFELSAQFDGMVRVTTVSGAITLDDPAKRVRTPEIGDHSVTAEYGAAAGESRIETTAGAVVLRSRAQ